jgi:hypothetical protein
LQPSLRSCSWEGGQKAQQLPGAWCQTNSTERSRATLHGAGAKTGAWTMEGQDNLVQQRIVYPLKRALSRKKPTCASRARKSLQQRSLCRIMRLQRRRRSRSASALPPTRSLNSPSRRASHAVLCCAQRREYTRR